LFFDQGVKAFRLHVSHFKDFAHKVHIFFGIACKEAPEFCYEPALRIDLLEAQGPLVGGKEGKIAYFFERGIVFLQELVFPRNALGGGYECEVVLDEEFRGSGELKKCPAL